MDVQGLSLGHHVGLTSPIIQPPYEEQVRWAQPIYFFSLRFRTPSLREDRNRDISISGSKIFLQKKIRAADHVHLWESRVLSKGKYLLQSRSLPS